MRLFSIYINSSRFASVNATVLLILTLCNVAKPADEVPPHEVKWQAIAGKCCLGHENLRTVPVLYGMVVMSKELQQKVDDLEIVLGGCIGGGAQTQTICTKCRYAYDSKELWSKHSEKVLDFEVPLKDFIAKFPLFENLKSKRVYYQTLKGRVATEEEVIYWSDSSVKEITESLKLYFKDLNMNFTEPVDRRNTTLFQSRNENATLEVAIEGGHRNGEIYVKAIYRCESKAFKNVP